MPSANTLRNSLGMATNLDSKTDRFKVIPKGGQYSEATYIKSYLNLNKFNRPVDIPKEDIPNGRPLFVRELSKVVPPANTYDIKREIGAKVNPK